MGHARIEIDPDAVFQHPVGRHLIAGVHRPPVALGREDDPDVNTPPSGLDQTVKDMVVSKVGVLDVDITFGVVDGRQLGPIDVRVTLAG